MDDDSNICQHSHIRQGLTLVYNDPSPNIGLYTHKLKPALHLYTFKPQPLPLQRGTLVILLFLLCLCTLPMLTSEHVTLIYHGMNDITSRMKLLWAQRNVS